jgi:hypothetical protein
MNKLIGALLSGLLILSQSGVRAQVTDNAKLLNVHAMGVEPAAVKASRDFWQRVGDQKEEQWYKGSTGYQAEFADGPTKALYSYDKKGHFTYSILTYSENKLPEDVRYLVRSTYFDYGISWVKEVNEAQDLVYVIHMENDKHWMDVAVQDGDMRVLREFSK